MRIHIVIADDSIPWDDLTIEQFRYSLQRHRPDAAFSTVSSAPDLQTGRPTLELEFYLDVSGERCRGMYVEGRQLITWDGQPAGWSTIIEWFLSQLPKSAKAECILEQNPIPHPIPSGATSEDITQLIEQLDAAV